MSWNCAPSRRMRSTSSTRRATSALSLFLPIVGAREGINPGRVPVVQGAVAERRELLAVLVRPQVRAALEHEPVAGAEVEQGDHGSPPVVAQVEHDRAAGAGG